MDLSQRYERNALSAQQQRRLGDASVLVLGCGGLGGCVIEELARVGVGHITAADGDVFQPSNLNRQLLSSEANLGQSKAEAAADRVRAVNSSVDFRAVPEMATEANINALMGGAQLVIDCLDDPDARLLAARAAARAGIPFLHGAVSGWCLRVYTLLPGDGLLEFLCGRSGRGTEAFSGALPFTAAVCASLEAAEAVKQLLGMGRSGAGRLLEWDLLELRFEEIDLSGAQA